jgi:long-chain acyl-CoA synthetase
MDPETIPQRIRRIAERHPQIPAQMTRSPEKSNVEDKSFRSVSYKDFWDEVNRFGAGLVTLGLERGAHVGMIADNRREWLIADLAVLGLGACDIPRGTDSTQSEMSYILHHAECTMAMADDAAQAGKILTSMLARTTIRVLVVLDDSLPDDRSAPPSLQLLNYSEVLARGQTVLAKDPRAFEDQVDQGHADDLATIIYTSGTTGEPKGVMLTHRSFTFQVDRIYPVLGIKAGQLFLSVLPVWHAYERAIEYVVLCCGATIAYSKPVGKILLEDLATIRPHWFPSVPRIWESVRSSIYRTVKAKSPFVRVLFDFFVAVGSTHADLLDHFLDRWPRFHHHWNIPTQAWTALPLVLLWPLKALGGLLLFRKLRGLLGDRFIAGISGGGALPGHVDRFFRAIGILVLEGYGLTECGPVLGVRVEKHPVPQTVGPLLKEVAFKVIDEETGKRVGPGRQGELWVKSPQVMVGYYKRPDATAKVLQDGWLNTGDLVIRTVHREFRIVGRSKDTIVLRGGENIEPEPIERKLGQSDFIDQVMVVGQDQKYLGALIVPRYDSIEGLARERRITYLDREELLDNSQIVEAIHENVQHLVSPRTGFKNFERVFRFTLLSKPFEVGVELTPKLSLKRNVIAQKYAKQIAGLFDQKDTD